MRTGIAEPSDNTVRLGRQEVIWAFLMAAAFALVAVSSRSQDWSPFWLFVLLFAFALVSEALAVELTANVWLSGEMFAMVLAMTLLGPAPAAVIGVGCLLIYGVTRRTRPLLVMRNLATVAVEAVCGGLLARWAIDAFDIAIDEPEFAVLVLVVFAFSLVLNLLQIGLILRLAEGGRVLGPMKDVKQLLAAELPTALLTGVSAVVYAHTGVAALGVYALALLVFQYMLRELKLSQQRAGELAKLQSDRRRLVAQALDAEDRERQRLAEALHDDALQNLLAARQDLQEVGQNGGGESIRRASAALDQTVQQLRAATFELHPAVLLHAGLESALRDVAERQAQRGGFEARVSVAPDAVGHADSLLFSLAREQLVNAAKHAGASVVSVTIERARDQLELEVADDGRGMEEGRASRAVAQGHIGLAAGAERVEAIGGRLEIISAPGAGTRIRTRLPVDAVAPAD